MLLMKDCASALGMLYVPYSLLNLSLASPMSAGTFIADDALQPAVRPIGAPGSENASDDTTTDNIE